MKLIISSHNKQILTLRNKQVGYNCRVRNTTSLGDEYKYYQGLAEKLLKNDIVTIKICLKIKTIKAV